MSGSGGSGWKPGSDLVNWKCQAELQGPNDDPDMANRWSQCLLAASPEAFADLEGEMYSIINLCEMVAPALRNAETVEWYGDAREKFTAAVGHFPKHLHTIAEGVQTGLNALVHFSDVTFTQKNLYNAAIDEMNGLQKQYTALVEAQYPSEHDGMAVIRPMQHKLQEVWTRMNTCLLTCADARGECMATFASVANNMPRESPFTALLSFLGNAVTAVGTAFGDTPDAILGFLKDPDLKTLEQLGKDLATDGAAIATVLTGGAALAEVGGLDAALDGSLIAAASEAGDYAAGVSLNATIVTAGDQFARGEVGDGLVTAIFAAAGYDSPGDADSALNQVRALNNFNQVGFDGLDEADQKVIQALFPHVSEDDLASAAESLSGELETKLKGATTAAGVEQLEDFLKRTFIEEPAKHAVGDG